MHRGPKGKKRPADVIGNAVKVMWIELNTVRTMFEDVLAGNISREAADRWAYNLVQAQDRSELEYKPSGDRERIWSGIMYLYGIDLLQAPDQYLNSEQDIREAIDAKLGARLPNSD